MNLTQIAYDDGFEQRWGTWKPEVGVKSKPGLEDDAYSKNRQITNQCKIAPPTSEEVWYALNVGCVWGSLAGEAGGDLKVKTVCFLQLNQKTRQHHNKPSTYVGVGRVVSWPWSRSIQLPLPKSSTSTSGSEMPKKRHKYLLLSTIKPYKKIFACRKITRSYLNEIGGHMTTYNYSRFFFCGFLESFGVFCDISGEVTSGIEEEIKPGCKDAVAVNEGKLSQGLKGYLGKEGGLGKQTGLTFPEA